jgi:hypothetical protein
MKNFEAHKMMKLLHKKTYWKRTPSGEYSREELFTFNTHCLAINHGHRLYIPRSHIKTYFNKLFSWVSGCDTDRCTFLDCAADVDDWWDCCWWDIGSDWGCLLDSITPPPPPPLLSVVVLKLSNEKSLRSDGWYDAAGL